MRLNKWLSSMGICSRRQADRMVSEGRLAVNGQPASLGMTVSEEDEIRLDGKLIEGKPEDVQPILLKYNKPRGVVCTTTGNDRALNIIEAINYPQRIYPIGRLDKDSEGLILLTNQGEILNGINRARFFHEKEYIVTVDKAVTESFLDAISKGVYLPELNVRTRPCKVWQDKRQPGGFPGQRSEAGGQESLRIPLNSLKLGGSIEHSLQSGSKEFHIILTQGLNRQIRRMCALFDYKVTRLIRIRIMDIELGGLRPGEYKELDYSHLSKCQNAEHSDR